MQSIPNETMKKLIRTPILLTILLLFASCDKEQNPVAANGSEFLSDLVSKIENHQYGGEVHSLIIVKNDSIILEKYFNGYSRSTKHPLYSVTKSFLSTLIGICIQQGTIDSLNTRVLDFFPEYRSTLAHYDSSKENITVRHLLTMTAGFSWDLRIFKPRSAL